MSDDKNTIPYKLYRDRAHVLPGSDEKPRFCLELSNLPEATVRSVIAFLGDRAQEIGL